MAVMERKQFKMIAKTIKETKEFSIDHHLSIHFSFQTLAQELAKELKAENPLFNKKKFYEACGF